MVNGHTGQARRHVKSRVEKELIDVWELENPFPAKIGHDVAGKNSKTAERLKENCPDNYPDQMKKGINKRTSKSTLE
jgi:hypothetical protein